VGNPIDGNAVSAMRGKKLLEKVRKYRTWTQVAGYFDGDGSVHLRTDSPVVLRFALVWVDNCFEQLLQLKGFLSSRGITLGNVLRQGVGVFRLQIASPRFCLAAAKQMSPFCFKKEPELTILKDYYENKINGTEAISRINEMVVSGIRLGKIRPSIVLPKYAEGKLMVARARGLKAAEARWRRSRNPGTES
jgi:hypothetical protein